MAARSDRTLRTTCEVVVGQAQALAEASDELSSAQLARLAVLLEDVLDALGHPTTARQQNLASLLDHRSAGRARLDSATQDCLGDGRELLARRCASLTADLASALAGQLPVSVSNQFGNSHLNDYLRATLLELLVLATPAPGARQAAALRMGVRALSQAIGERFAGQTIEVRIPPASAVQLAAFGEGPTHTRGTPPNVVETDEATWLELGTGLLTLDEALDQARATASGTHCDALSRMLPVIDLRRLA